MPTGRSLIEGATRYISADWSPLSWFAGCFGLVNPVTERLSVRRAVICHLVLVDHLANCLESRNTCVRAQEEGQQLEEISPLKCHFKSEG